MALSIEGYSTPRIKTTLRRAKEMDYRKEASIDSNSRLTVIS